MEQNVNRRRFLGAAIGTGAAAALAPTALAHGRHAQKSSSGGANKVPRNRRGIQLYTMREKMTNQADARQVLRFLGRAGYTEVETAGPLRLDGAAVPRRAGPCRAARGLRPRRAGLHLPGRLAGRLRETLAYAEARSARSTPAGRGSQARTTT